MAEIFEHTRRHARAHTHTHIRRVVKVTEAIHVFETEISIPLTQGTPAIPHNTIETIIRVASIVNFTYKRMKLLSIFGKLQYFFCYLAFTGNDPGIENLFFSTVFLRNLTFDQKC